MKICTMKRLNCYLIIYFTNLVIGIRSALTNPIGRAGSRPRQVRPRPKAPTKKKKKSLGKKGPTCTFFLLVIYKFYYWLTNCHVINHKKRDINIH